MESYSFDPENNYQAISFEDSVQINCRHAAHCCIYSPNPFTLFKKFIAKAYVCMHMRFDGSLGFPGGMTHDGAVTGLNRELVEEMNLSQKYFVTQDDHLFSSMDKKSNLCMHFFKKEVSPEEFLEIEKMAVNSKEYGREVMGMVRVPLVYMKDGIGGFPTFIANQFAGNSKNQLLNFLVHTGIMTEVEVKEALAKSMLTRK